MSAVIYPEDFDIMADKLREQLKTGNTIHNENRLICRDGSVKWISIKAQLFTEEDGEQYFYCVFVDITDEKQLQQRVLNLYEKELSYFAEVSSAEGSIQGSLNVTQGRLETYVSTSEMAVAHIGDSYEDTILSLERSAMDPEMGKRIGSTLEREKVLADYANGKTDYHFEFLRRSNTGSSFWESTKLRSFRNPESGDVLLFSIL